MTHRRRVGDLVGILHQWRDAAAGAPDPVIAQMHLTLADKYRSLADETKSAVAINRRAIVQQKKPAGLRYTSGGHVPFNVEDSGACQTERGRRRLVSGPSERRRAS